MGKRYALRLSRNHFSRSRRHWLALGTTSARAGDDGAAPLWVGIGSIVGPFVGLNKDAPPPIDYREHGKLVVPPKMDLPPPAAPPSAAAGDWPVDQEIVRKKAEKEDAKKHIAGVRATRGCATPIRSPTPR